MKLIFLIEGSAFLPRRSVSILSSTYAKNSVLLSLFSQKLLEYICVQNHAISSV